MSGNGETHRGIVTRRWTEQRWLIDNVIRSVGVDWDQPRTVSYNAPCGPEANADFAAIRERVKKYADIAGYATPEEFVTHALEKELAKLEDADSEEEIRKRLKGLGYIS